MTKGSSRRGNSTTWLLALALAPLGCQQGHLPALDLESAALVDPSGRVPLEIASRDHAAYTSPHERRMVASYRGMSVTVGVLPGAQLVAFDDPQQSHEVEAVAGAAYYQRNGGERIPVEVRLRSHGREYFTFSLPPPVSTFEMIVTGGTLIPATVKKIEAHEGDVHTVHLPFRVDGDPCAIDVSFRITLEARGGAAAPATP